MGKLITFEGGEGAGKTTQVALLAGFLQEVGHAVTVVREPGGTVLGEQVRTVLLTEGIQITPWAEAFLFNAARAQLVSEVIRPALRRGDIVLCDRYTDSTIAYQGFARGVNVLDLNLVNAMATGSLVPALTFYLDIDPVIGLSRKTERNRIDAETLEFHRLVRAGYLSNQFLPRWRTIDASLPVDVVRMQIWEQFSKEIFL